MHYARGNIVEKNDFADLYASVFAVNKILPGLLSTPIFSLELQDIRHLPND